MVEMVEMDAAADSYRAERGRSAARVNAAACGAQGVHVLRLRARLEHVWWLVKIQKHCIIRPSCTCTKTYLEAMD